MPRTNYGGKEMETPYWIRWEDHSISIGCVDLEETKELAEQEAVEKRMTYVIV